MFATAGKFKISGDQSTVKAGTEMQGENRKNGSHSQLAEMDKGSWVVFQLPGFAKAASGTQQASMDALRMATETSWFKDGNDLWSNWWPPAPVSPIIRPTDQQASITASR